MYASLFKLQGSDFTEDDKPYSPPLADKIAKTMPPKDYYTNFADAYGSVPMYISYKGEEDLDDDTTGKYPVVKEPPRPRTYEERIAALEDELAYYKKIVERNDNDTTAIHQRMMRMEAIMKDWSRILEQPGAKLVYDNGTLETPPRLIDRDL